MTARLEIFKNLKGISALIVIALLVTFPVKIHAQEEHALPWGYEGGTGPEHWGEIEQEHEKHLMCREGIYQSPIDIHNVPGLKLADLGFNFSPTPIHILNNGHTIHLNYDPGSFTHWENEKFELIQFHFHSPSEHLLNGKHYDMEMHLVHKTPDHQYVVLGIFMKKGQHNPTIQKIWDRIPAVKNKEVSYEDHLFNVKNLLPATKKYFHYTGSLTTPPCSENVSWFIFEKSVEVSAEQIRFFQKFIKYNARPAQKLHHRIVIKVK